MTKVTLQCVCAALPKRKALQQAEQVLPIGPASPFLGSFTSCFAPQLEKYLIGISRAIYAQMQSVGPILDLGHISRMVMVHALS